VALASRAASAQLVLARVSRLKDPCDRDVPATHAELDRDYTGIMNRAEWAALTSVNVSA
jgi:hypothetical protein